MTCTKERGLRKTLSVSSKSQDRTRTPAGPLGAKPTALSPKILKALGIWGEALTQEEGPLTMSIVTVKQFPAPL